MVGSVMATMCIIIRDQNPDDPFDMRAVGVVVTNTDMSEDKDRGHASQVLTVVALDAMMNYQAIQLEHREPNQ